MSTEGVTLQELADAINELPEHRRRSRLRLVFSDKVGLDVLTWELKPLFDENILEVDCSPTTNGALLTKDLGLDN